MPIVDTSNPFAEELKDANPKQHSDVNGASHETRPSQSVNSSHRNFSGGDSIKIGTWQPSDAFNNASESPPKQPLTTQPERLPVSARLGTPNTMPPTTHQPQGSAQPFQFEQQSHQRPHATKFTFSSSSSSSHHQAARSSAVSLPSTTQSTDFAIGNWADAVLTPQEADICRPAAGQHAKSPSISQAQQPSRPLPPPPTPDDMLTPLVKQSHLNKIINQRLVDVQAAYTPTIISEMENLYLKDDSTGGKRKTWDDFNLKPEIRRALTELHFDYPSRIQALTLGDLLSGKNMIAQSQSGTGKTAAFAITMLQTINMDDKHPQALCLEPTMELAQQTANVIERLGKYMKSSASSSQVGIKVIRALKGIDMTGQAVQGQICVGTPGKTKDWLSKQRGTLIMDPRYIRLFVLDEADVMLEMQGLGDQTHRIKMLLQPTCQLAFFSATYDDNVKSFGEKVVGPNAVNHFLEVKNLSLDNIKQFYVRVRNRDEKYQSLANLYGTLSVNQCMVFCTTRDTAHWLTQKLQADGHPVELLSGDMDVADRTATLERFRQSIVRVLITTNVSARGLDITQVNLVINFDLPFLQQTKRADCETYLHRIGRSGRFGRGGIAINYVANERDEELMREIEQHFQRRVERLSTEDLQEIEQTIENYGTSAAAPTISSDLPVHS